MLDQVLIAISFPVAAGIIGGLIAAFRPPSKLTASAVQHFAAGVVMAAVTTEVIPDMLEGEHVLALIIGFMIGVAVMLGLSEWERRAEARGVGATVLLVAVAIDLLIDGLLIGVAFLAGSKQGRLITLALTLEILFLGLSVAATLAKQNASRGRVIITTSVLALLPAVTAIIAVTFLEGLSGAPFVLILAFASAALLYLVVEELLTEAHEAAAERWWLTLMFFLGFILIAVIELIG